jgi:hypothetical protein
VPAVTTQERIVATIRKGNRNAVVVTVSQHDQRPRIGIRQHEPNGKRQLIPTMKGIGNIDLATASEIAKALMLAVARAS